MESTALAPATSWYFASQTEGHYGVTFWCLILTFSEKNLFPHILQHSSICPEVSFAFTMRWSWCSKNFICSVVNSADYNTQMRKGKQRLPVHNLAKSDRDFICYQKTRALSLQICVAEAYPGKVMRNPVTMIYHLVPGPIETDMGSYFFTLSKYRVSISMFSKANLSFMFSTLFHILLASL